MAFSPEHAESLAQDLSLIYGEAEDQLMLMIADRLTRGLDAPEWAENKLLQTQVLQMQASGLLARLQGRTRDEIALALMKAWNRGDAMARADLHLIRERDSDLDLVDVVRRNIGHPGLPPVESLVLEHYNRVIGLHGAILRAVKDTYRDLIYWTSAQVLTGVRTRREAAAAALKEFAFEGIKAFTDSAGRKWQIESYVEMSTRAAVANAGVQGHVDRLVTNGHDLVRVSDAPQECKLCRPWEGKVLYLLGVENPPAEVKVAGSLGDAKRAGLFHPNCRHSISIYIPGVTKLQPHGPTPDPQGDKDRQKLRYLEREVRKAKRWSQVSEVAGFDLEKQAADMKVRQIQAKIREHVATTTAKRQPQRERLGAR